MIESIFLISLLGLSLGSFINVCIYRIPQRMSVISLRSFCTNCHRTLHWYELLPIISFIMIRGACKRCSSKISFRYPLIELGIGLLAAALFLRYGISGQYVYSTSFIVLMVLVAVIDWQYFIIPNTVVITGIILGLILHLVFQPDQFAQHLLSSLFAFCSTLIILLLGNWLFKKPSMGMGDVKLAGLIGFFLGIQDFLVAFWLAAILGALYGMFAFGFHGSSKGSNLPPQNPPVGKQGQGRFRPPLFEAVQKVIITVIASEAKQPQPLNFPRNVRLLRHFVTRNDAFGRFLDSHMSRLGTEGVMMSTEFNPRFATTFDEGVLSSTKLPFGSFLALSSSVVLLLSDMIDKWIQVWLISLQ